jgi:hypothetical protein
MLGTAMSAATEIESPEPNEVHPACGLGARETDPIELGESAAIRVAGTSEP